jgi:beta-carotene hydroxylase
MQADLEQLNREAIMASKKYTGAPAWGTVVLLVFVLCSMSLLLDLFASGDLALWVALPVYAVFTYMSYTPLHEAVHNNIHGDRERLKWLNDACGYLAALLIFVPYSTHKIEHFTHHRYTNQPDKDPDYVVSNMGHGFFSFIVSGFHFLWVQVTFLFRSHWRTTSLKGKSLYFAELVCMVAWRVLYGVWVGTSEVVLLLVLGYLLGAFFTAYWFAYRPHHPYERSARYQNTSSLIMPGWLKPLEWLWLGQNLHSIHHLFPRVPFYRYHALHRDIEPVLRAQGTPIVGIFSRRPITGA